MLAFLVILVCLSNASLTCQSHGIVIDIADFGQCFRQGSLQARTWAAAHPEFKVQGWRCRVVRPVGFAPV